MSPESQRIAIAEACGFCFCRSEVSGGIEEWHDGDGEIVHTLPDYLNDLNAMHEAEKVLVGSHNGLGSWTFYANCLMRICGSHQECIHATAAQRSEAFLRTLGLWEE